MLVNSGVISLCLIQDGPADGPANMERDRALLQSLGETVILRFYQWTPNWVSYGYFQTEDIAKARFPSPSLRFVRRPTGGGVVDHRRDLTYSLLIPKGHPLAKFNRSESYARIHEIVHLALASSGVESLVVTAESGEGSACFEHPVPGDLMDPHTGHKLAGAAQRRTRNGLLHQGSILAPGLETTKLAQGFSDCL